MFYHLLGNAQELGEIGLHFEYVGLPVGVHFEAEIVLADIGHERIECPLQIGFALSGYRQ